MGMIWSETDFLREYSWVVFCCGFREQIVRKWFSYISMTFFDFVSARQIVEHHQQCRDLALAAISNKAKIDAIVETAKCLDAMGFVEFRAEVLQHPVHRLTELPFIGGVTCNHLLKNLGFNVAKNDRHLERLSAAFHFDEAHSLCEQIARLTGEPTSVVDVILWRYSELSSRSFKKILEASETHECCFKVA
jgi:hypothetical protein